MNKFAAIAIIGTASAVSVSREPLLTWAPTEPASHPINYPVPNFGVDHEILATSKHTAQAEKQLGITWTPTQDEDGVWDTPTETAQFHLLQTGSNIRREPLLTWEATEPASHPINYFVPNFGLDHDIKASLKHSEGWTPVKDKDDEWVVPKEDAFFKI